MDFVHKIPPPVANGQNIKMDRILTKIFYIVFQVLKVLLIKMCKIKSLDLLFLLVFISFYISRYHFSQVFRTSFNIIWEKIFVTNFPFLMDSLKLLYTLIAPKSTKHDKCFWSILPTYQNFSRLTLGRARTGEFNQYFNPTPGSLSSYKPLDWG